MSREQYRGVKLYCYLENEKENLRLPIGEFESDENDDLRKWASLAFDSAKSNLKKLFAPADYRIVVVDPEGKPVSFGLDSWVKFKDKFGGA